MKRPLQQVEQPKNRPEIDIDVVEEVCRDVAARSAILEKLAMAWCEYNPGGINLKLDQDFWRGVEDLMRDNRNDLALLYAQVDVEAEKGDK